MNNECQIKDDDEIIEEEKSRFNFRRFKPEELEKKYSPFERTKKEFPFLFQKKRESPKEEHKISLEDIITKVKDLSVNSPELQALQNKIAYSPHTPPYGPYSPIPEFFLDGSGNSVDLNTRSSKNIDDQ